LEREGVSFSGDEKPFEDQCWRLFRVFQFLVPAVVVASGLPVSLYGVGSCKLVFTGSGHRFRQRFSGWILGLVLRQVKAPKAQLGRRAVLNRFWTALSLFLVQERGSESPLQANRVELDFED
jgi:hypothetical protein